MNIVRKSLERELMTEFLIERQSLQTFVSSSSPVQLTNTEDLQTWLQQDSLANRFRSQVSKKEKTTTGICGQKQSQSFVKYDRVSHSWRTSQVCLLTRMPGEYLETWPKAGLMQNGECYQQPKWERRIREIGSGYSVPTPTTAPEAPNKNANTNGPKNLLEVANGEWEKLFPTIRSNLTGKISPNRINDKNNNLEKALSVQMFPTPTASEGGRNKSASDGAKIRPSLGMMASKNMWPTPTTRERLGKSQMKRNEPGLAMRVGGHLNPEWVEWLMGWPIGWTELRPLEMDKCLSAWFEHGFY